MTSMTSITTIDGAIHHHPLPSVSESEAATALNIARARTIASKKILDALQSGTALAAPMLKLCIDALKLSVDRAAAPAPEGDLTTLAPELQHALEHVLRMAGEAFARATDPGAHHHEAVAT